MKVNIFSFDKTAYCRNVIEDSTSQSGQFDQIV